ncbi:MAG: hypothetical protein WDM90_01145 [Ferruginibacter sp.]
MQNTLFQPMRKRLLFLTVVLSVLFFTLNFLPYNINEYNGKVAINEKFDSSLVRLNSLNKLEQYTDSLALAKHIAIGTMDYALIANEVISQRFYHKYAAQNLNENWIASLAQRITGLYLSSKITADDILTRPYGYCGQINTVLMELLERKKLNCRVVYLPHHFVIESYINGRWNYFDADMKPNILPQKRSDENFLKNKDSLAYAYNTDIASIEFTFGNPVTFKYGKVNETQGRNAQIFQAITKVLSKIAFLFPILLCYVYLRKKSIATNNTQQTATYQHNHLYGNERTGSRTQRHQSWPRFPRFFNG